METNGAILVGAGSEEVWLRADRSVWWEAGRTVFVADLHLGKAAVFRARGIPVPEGSDGETLGRLEESVGVLGGGGRLVVLGDVLHAREAGREEVLGGLRDWVGERPELEVVLVLGNHDRSVRGRLAELGAGFGGRVRVVEEWRAGGLAGRHFPDVGEEVFVLAGHEHPVAVVRGSGRQRLRLPCFWWREGVGVLPSFGGFTGGRVVGEGEGGAVYVVGGRRVLAGA